MNVTCLAVVVVGVVFLLGYFITGAANGTAQTNLTVSHSM